jgi:hypothetical protein
MMALTALELRHAQRHIVQLRQAIRRDDPVMALAHVTEAIADLSYVRIRLEIQAERTVDQWLS